MRAPGTRRVSRAPGQDARESWQDCEADEIERSNRRSRPTFNFTGRQLQDRRRNQGPGAWSDSRRMKTAGASAVSTVLTVVLSIYQIGFPSPNPGTGLLCSWTLLRHLSLWVLPSAFIRATAGRACLVFGTPASLFQSETGAVQQSNIACRR